MMEPLKPPPDGNVNRGAALSIPTLTTTIIATILTGLRIYARAFVLKRLGKEDVFNVLGLIFMIVATGLIVPAVSDGIGQHIFYLQNRMAQVSYGLMLVRISEFFIIFSGVCTRISITFFLNTLFNIRRSVRLILWSWIAFHALESAVNAAVIFLSCTPVQKTWDQSVPGTCWPEQAINAMGLLQGVTAVLSDIMLSTLPIFFLWKVKIRLKTKLSICALLTMGYGTAAFAIARTVLVPGLGNPDITWVIVNLFLFGVLEANIGLFACALPGIRPLFQSRKNAADSESMARSQSMWTGTKASHSRRMSWPRSGDDPLLSSASHDVELGERSSESHTPITNHASNESWLEDGHGIKRTTDIELVHGINPPEKAASKY